MSINVTGSEKHEDARDGFYTIRGDERDGFRQKHEDPRDGFYTIRGEHRDGFSTC